MVKSGAVIFGTHVEALAAFYEAIVPLARLGADHGAIILENETMQLVIHPLRGTVDGPLPAGAPPLREDSHIKLAFAVDSLARVRAAAPGLGGGLRPASAEFATRGFRACDGHDPENNVIQFRAAVA